MKLEENWHLSLQKSSNSAAYVSPILHETRLGSLACLNSARKRLLAKFVNQMVASTFGFTADHLLRSERGDAKAARARQVSIYLMHTCLSFSLTEIAKLYSKDRTTIGHACRVIEDKRDTPAFDDRIIELEQTIQTVLVLAQNDAVTVGRQSDGK